MQCDICGKTTRVFLADMEGAKIYVCSACNPSGEGKIIRPRTEHNNNFVKKTYVPKFTMRKQEPFDLNNYDLIENYADQIKQLREANKKTFEEFAKDLYVTASYLQKVEQDKLKPSAGLLLKIYEKYGLLLINKKPGADAKELPQKREFHHRDVKRDGPRKDFKPRFNKDFKPRERHNDFILREEKITTPKEIYAPEEQKGEAFESVSHNNKKKIILS
jgi:uncharacterized protein (TIGR00270 family)